MWDKKKVQEELDFYHLPEQDKWEQEQLKESLNKLGETLEEFYNGSTFMANVAVEKFIDFVNNHPKNKDIEYEE